jgi:prepilin-type N-terminal cleavage/methylation domain-containing protein
VRTGVGRTGASRQAGFSLVELLTSIVIMVVITGAIFSLVDPSRGTARAQTEVADQQQRMRVASDMMSKDLIMAGAGTYSGAIAGTLANFFAPVLPYANGALYSGWTLPVPRFVPDQVTVIYVPNTAAQTFVRDPMPQPSSEIKVNAQPGCPIDDQLCGFKQGMRVVIFDDTGAFDVFTITEVQTDALHLQHRPPNPDFSKRYTPAENATIAQCDTHSYIRCDNDPATPTVPCPTDPGIVTDPSAPVGRLLHYNGWVDTAGQPPAIETVADNVVGMQVQYFGDPNPPLAPRPAIGLSNCVFDASGNPALPVLPSNGESLVELTPALLTSGPVCGVVPNQFDADLYRVKKIRVTLRMQVASRDLRGTGNWFASPGTSTAATRFAPDYAMSFEVSPRNLNLTR